MYEDSFPPCFSGNSGLLVPTLPDLIARHERLYNLRVSGAPAGGGQVSITLPGGSRVIDDLFGSAPVQITK